MPLKSIVKVSQLSNLSDARYCAGMGVDILGFSVVPGNEHYVTVNVFQDIRGWISGPRISAELYGISSASEIDEVIRAYAPDYFELSVQEYLRYESALTLPCIVYLPLAADAGLLGTRAGIAYVVVDEHTSCGDLTLIDRPVLVKVSSQASLAEKAGQPCFDGYVLQGSKESRPGITNYDALGVLLEALEDD